MASPAVSVVLPRGVQKWATFGFAAPANAMELILRRLGAQVEEVSFAMVGDEIRATRERQTATLRQGKYESKSSGRPLCTSSVTCASAPLSSTRIGSRLATWNSRTAHPSRPVTSPDAAEVAGSIPAGSAFKLPTRQRRLGRATIGRLPDHLQRLRLDPGHSSAPGGLVFRKPPALHVVWG
jgi:hypothetical protein